jgi:aldehyde dehydrogenase (NAD+)
MAAAAPTLTPVTLELGGKSPVQVTEREHRCGCAFTWIKLLNRQTVSP